MFSRKLLDSRLPTDVHVDLCIVNRKPAQKRKQKYHHIHHQYQWNYLNARYRMELEYYYGVYLGLRLICHAGINLSVLIRLLGTDPCFTKD